MAMPGTVPCGYDADVTILLTVPFSKDNMVEASANEFSQHEIKMEMTVCGRGDFVKLVLADVDQSLQRDTEGSVVVFCNTRYLVLKLPIALGKNE